MNVLGYATQGKDENLETVGCEILRRTLLSLMSGNIVVVTKKYGKTIVCLDYINVLVVNVTKSDTYSFMNGFSRYNQIRMTEKKREKKYLYHTLGNLLLQISAIWIEKYRDQLSKGNGPLVS
jgi:hypothetical protein